ncbi:MAG: hypothetical protein QM607_06810, partial [Microbacterium sp.]
MAPARKRNIALIVTTAVGAVVILGGGGAIAWAVLAGKSDEPTASISATPTTTPTATTSATPTTTPEPEAVDLPYSVAVEGWPDGWYGSAATEIADVSAQVGEAADGEAAGYIDAPVVDDDTDALNTTVTVKSGTTYDFSAQVRQLAELPAEVAAYITIGDDKVELPELNASWTEVTAEY